MRRHKGMYTKTREPHVIGIVGVPTDQYSLHPFPVGLQQHTSITDRNALPESLRNVILHLVLNCGADVGTTPRHTVHPAPESRRSVDADIAPRSPTLHIGAQHSR